MTVEPAEGGSLVTLVHEGLTEEQETMHAEGWNHYFERLEKLAATGTAGQDEWAWAPENLDPLVAAEAALAVIQPMLRNLTPADQPKPTPCTDFSCHDAGGAPDRLAGHTRGDGGRQRDQPRGRVTREPGLGDDRPGGSGMARSVDRGNIAGPGGNEMPAAFAASILPVELLLHGWDLAQGSGQDLHVSDEVVTYIRELSEGLIPGGRSGGSFGDEVSPAPGANALDRLAAYAGRNPVAA